MTSLKQNHTNYRGGGTRKYKEIDHIRVKEAVDKATAEGTRTVDTVQKLLTEWEGPPTTFEGLRYLIKMWQRWPWGIKEYMDMDTHRVNWTPKEDDVLRDWHQRKPAKASAELIKELVLSLNKANPKTKRTYPAVTERIHVLNLGKPQNTGFVFDPRHLAKVGLKVEDGYEVKNSRGSIPLECIAQGHKFKRLCRETTRTGVTGCTVCNGTNHGNEFLSEDYFVRYPEKKVEPCYIYQVNFPQFERPTTKPGRAKDWRIRVASYPEHELYNLRLLTLYEVFRLERVFQDKFGNYRTNPEELKNPSNGWTEGFELSIKDKIADIIDEYESGTFK